MKLLNFLALSLAFIAFTSCQPKTAEVASVSNATDASINGSWSTDCLVNNSSSALETFQVENGVLTMATLFYSGTLCEQDKLIATLIQNGQLTLSGANAALDGGNNYEWLQTVAVAIPNDSSIVDFLNNESACGTSSWTINQHVSILGCSAANAFDFSQVAPGTIHYGVFKIDAEATPNSLLFGEDCTIPGYEKICPTEQNRPTVFRNLTYFRR